MTRCCAGIACLPCAHLAPHQKSDAATEGAIRLFGLQTLAAPQVSYRNSSTKSSARPSGRWAHGPGIAKRCYAPRAARSVVWRPSHVFTVRASGIGVYSVSRTAMPARASGESWRSSSRASAERPLAGLVESGVSTRHRIRPLTCANLVRDGDDRSSATEAGISDRNARRRRSATVGMRLGG